MNQHLIACPVLNKELQLVLAELVAHPHVHFMDYSIHINADIMEQELHKHCATCGDNSQLGILVGKDCKALQPIETIAKNNNATLASGQNCIEMILGKEQLLKLQKNRTAIMTPGWITMMKQSIQDGNWRVEDARINMGWYDQILLLDTGTAPLTDELIMSFFELTEVPIDILKVDLRHFKQVVADLLLNR